MPIQEEIKAVSDYLNRLAGATQYLADPKLGVFQNATVYRAYWDFDYAAIVDVIDQYLPAYTLIQASGGLVLECVIGGDDDDEGEARFMACVEAIKQEFERSYTFVVKMPCQVWIG